MEEVAAGAIVSRIRNELRLPAEAILALSEDLAHLNQENGALKDDLALVEARIRVNVSTAVNENGKPKYPNVDAQNARVLVEMSESDNYVGKKILMLDKQLEIEMVKAKLNREHEKRRDSRTEAELLVGLHDWF